MKIVSSDIRESITQSDGKISYEDFLACYEDTFAEWVDGRVIMSPPVSFKHQDIVGFLESLLQFYVVSRKFGKILMDPFQMKLDKSGREPDIIYISAQHLDRLKDLYLDGPADMVVEVISKESRHRDTVKKMKEYESAGILEYWLMDPIRKQAKFYRLGTDNLYHQVPLDNEDIYHSEVIAGFWLKVSWLWQEPLPLLEAWQEINQS
jgi:Uma2 family endonuclease